MNWQSAIVLVVTGLALLAFITERFRIDQVAVAVPAALLLAGILTPEEAVSGLSNSATVTVAAMLVASLGLLKTGAVGTIARWVRTMPVRSSALQLAVLCTVVAFISGFLNNTAVVVVFMPVFLAAAKNNSQPASLWLMPLSFSAILGGTTTLIGTSTNLLVQGMAKNRGFDELTLFSIAPLGFLYLAVGLSYLLVAGRWLLPRREQEVQLSEKYGVRRFATELLVGPESTVLGKTLRELDWPANHGVSVLGVQRGERASSSALSRALQVGDVIHAEGDAETLLALAERFGLGTPAHRRESLDFDDEKVHLVEIMVAPGSSIAGRTLRQLRFLHRFGATVLAVQHRGRIARGRLGDRRLGAGDVLLVHGDTAALSELADEPGLLPVAAARSVPPSRPGALVAVLILVGVVVAAASGLTSIMAASIMGVVLMFFSGCVRIEEAYDELDWMVVFLLAGLIPLGVALDKTGTAALLVGGVAELVEGASPTIVIGGFYLLASVLTEIMSNNAAAVVLTPIAIRAAELLEMNPYALIVAVMFGGSASFMTPMGYQTNAMIYGPGGYRFSDFLRIGAPLNGLLLCVASIAIPRLWP